MFNISIIFIQSYLNNIYYFYFCFIIFQILLLILLTIYVSFFGKKYLYVSYLYGFYILFIQSVVVSLFSNNIPNLIIISDFNQNYIFFKNFPISLIFNYLTVSFSCTTIQIAFFVNIFSIFYFINEQKFIKFFILLNFFVFSMVLLLHTNNFILLFLFWECIGITSYFLINFFELKTIVFKSAFKAFSFNRVSDVCILAALILYYSTVESFELSEINFMLFFSKNMYYNYFFFKISTLDLFLFFLCIAICCKSAQLGLHFWLPDSMEAPAPASALIHSATLVSAGVFLILKFLPLFKFSYFFSQSLMCIGTLTCLFGSLVSCIQTDIKRLLAYSTIGNCGLLIYSSIMLNSEITILFFKLHGFFKSLSFLFIGYLILKYQHLQDLRYIGNILLYEKIFLFLLLTSLSFLSAWFFSYSSLVKHIIMSPTNSQNYFFLINSILFCCTIIAVFYSLRLMVNIFNYNKLIKYINRSNWNINFIIATFFLFILFYISFSTLNIIKLQFSVDNTYIFFKYLLLIVFISKLQYVITSLFIYNKYKYLVILFILVL